MGSGGRSRQLEVSCRFGRPSHIPFLDLGGGLENDHLYVVVVLAEGLTREELEETPIVTLEEPYTDFFTPGIWIRW